MSRCFRCLVWILLPWMGSPSFAQMIRVRVINAGNGKPLAKVHISVRLLYEKSGERPSENNAVLPLKTDIYGEAQFMLPEPAPARLGVFARLSAVGWLCQCWAFVATQDVVQKGIVEGAALTRAAKPVSPEPGQISFLAHRRPFSERLLRRLLAPLME